MQNRSGKSAKICIIGAGPSGLSTLFQLAKLPVVPEMVCLEKQGTWGGMWNYSWLTGTDEYGEPCHNGMYRYLCSNNPKECLEYPDYTFEKHFGRPVPSFQPRARIRDYLEARFRSSKVDLAQYVKLHTVVRSVKYLDQSDEFEVTWQELETGLSKTEHFSHVIVATGIFNFPNKVVLPGTETFPGRIIHSHDFRCPDDFKNHQVLVVGSRYSAEDVAMMTIKFGAKSVVTTYRRIPMNFKFPKGIEERPPLKRIENNTVHFSDGSTAKVDSIVQCTGYVNHFPYMEDRLRLISTHSFYPDNLYKGTLFMGGGNNKLFYIGMQDQYFSFTMFDVEALWVARYIAGTLDCEPKTKAEMQKDIQAWIAKKNNTKDRHEDIDFQSDFVADLCKVTGYNPDAVKTGQLFHTWMKYRKEDILTFRDRCFSSNFSGTKATKPTTPWFSALDGSIETFNKNCV